LFLAAFGGVTVQEKHDPGALTAAIPPEFLLDDMRSLRDPADLVALFIEFLTGALIDDVVRVREVAREALGSELSPRLFSKLFRHLDEWVHYSWHYSCNSDGVILPGSRGILRTEQVWSLRMNMDYSWIRCEFATGNYYPELIVFCS
jgi:hypothetical protein